MASGQSGKAHLIVKRTIHHVVFGGTPYPCDTRNDVSLAGETRLSYVPTVEPAREDSPCELTVLPAFERIFRIAHVLFASKIDGIPRIYGREERNFIITRGSTKQIAIYEIKLLIAGEFGRNRRIA